MKFIYLFYARNLYKNSQYYRSAILTSIGLTFAKIKQLFEVLTLIISLAILLN